MKRWVALLVVMLLIPVYLTLPAWPLWSPRPTAEPSAPHAPPGDSGWRAVWVSYLEWSRMDLHDEAAFRAETAALLDNVEALGANVILAHLRPFGDALYRSDLAPFSHLCTGTQGQDPGYDPLAVLLEAAHARGIQVEAWLNPYRIQQGGWPALCEASPAMQHPDWVRTVGQDLYLNPAEPAVQQYLADVVTELCTRYPVDGIHFDDYFYPTTDPAFDGYTGDDLTAWRRGNVDALITACAAAARAQGVRFGVSPQGTIEGNRDGQYSDVTRWLAEGMVDYLAPQLYWGLQYRAQGSDRLALRSLAAQWLALPRHPDTALYFGLGAYRIGAGDGGDDPAEWQSGHALADQITALRDLCGTAPGVALYRYDSLFANTQNPTLAAQEVRAVWAAW